MTSSLHARSYVSQMVREMEIQTQSVGKRNAGKIQLVNELQKLERIC